jgi:hypothetical protein
MNRRWNDSRLRQWVRDPWNQTHMVVFGAILPAALLILALEVL